MSFLSRLPSRSRSSFDATLRFDLPDNNGLADEELDAGGRPLQALPQIESSSTDDFLNMFETPKRFDHSSKAQPKMTLSSVHPLRSTPAHQQRPELYIPATTPTQEPQRTRLNAVGRQDDMILTPLDTSYRASVSSSVPSSTTTRSFGSSTGLRTSSASSVTDYASSGCSSKGSDKENGYNYGKRRSDQGKRFSNRQPQSWYSENSRYSINEDNARSYFVGVDSVRLSRNASRGLRLGKAMATGVPNSPPVSPRSKQKPFRTMKSIEKLDNHTRKSSSSSASSGSSLVLPPCPGTLDALRFNMMANLQSIEDLFNCAMICKDFYHTFRQHEAILTARVLKRQSLAAWELRHSVKKMEKSSPFNLASIMRDYATLATLEDFIIWRCQKVLRPHSLDALLGRLPDRKAELEDALWLIWTFCNHFGKASTRTATTQRQVQWLEGHIQSTSRKAGTRIAARVPCTMKQLEDMSEMWTCLETLLSNFKGREDEAKRAGLFADIADESRSETELLNLWIADILSLGPKAVLTLSSCDFEQARVIGITRWKPSTKVFGPGFLKAAIEEVYRDTLMKEARRKALDYRKSIQHHHKRSSSDPAPPSMKPVITVPYKVTTNQPALRVNTRRTARQSMPLQIGIIAEQMDEVRPDCDPLSSVAKIPPPLPSSTSSPVLLTPLSPTRNASTRMGPSLFPMQNRDQSNRLSILPQPSDFEERRPQTADANIIDPSDTALALLTDEMGYPEPAARRALMLSDTGSGIDLHRAVDLLSSERTTVVEPRRTTISELPAMTGNARVTRQPHQPEICEGTCKPVFLATAKRERVTGLGVVKRGLSYRMSFRKSTRLSVIPDEEEIPSPRAATFMRRTTSTIESSATHSISSAAMTSTAPALPALPQEFLTRSSSTSTVWPIASAPLQKDWFKTDVNALCDVSAQSDRDSDTLKPKVTLQRVGTGIKKQSWGIPGMKRKQQVIQPEIIGYTY